MIEMVNHFESLQLLLKKSPVSASQVIAFNFNVANGIHPDHKKLLFPELISIFWEKPRFLGRMSKLILNRTGIEQTSYIEMTNTLWPLFTLPADRLQRLIVLVGALILGVRIRSSLSREHVTNWKKKLGEEAYRFAMNSASLLPAAQVPLPAIASDSAHDIGASAIISAVSAEPEALKSRVSLKLASDVNVIPMEPEKARRTLLLVMQIVEAEWCSSHAILRN